MQEESRKLFSVQSALLQLSCFCLRMPRHWHRDCQPADAGAVPPAADGVLQVGRPTPCLQSGGRYQRFAGLGRAVQALLAL